VTSLIISMNFLDVKGASAVQVIELTDSEWHIELVVQVIPPACERIGFSNLRHLKYLVYGLVYNWSDILRHINNLAIKLIVV